MTLEEYKKQWFMEEEKILYIEGDWILSKTSGPYKFLVLFHLGCENFHYPFPTTGERCACEDFPPYIKKLYKLMTLAESIM